MLYFFYFTRLKIRYLRSQFYFFINGYLMKKYNIGCDLMKILNMGVRCSNRDQKHEYLYEVMKKQNIRTPTRSRQRLLHTIYKVLSVLLTDVVIYYASPNNYDYIPGPVGVTRCSLFSLTRMITNTINHNQNIGPPMFQKIINACQAHRKLDPLFYFFIKGYLMKKQNIG